MQKKFDNAQDWCKRFLQEEEFVDLILKLRKEGGLEQVSLVWAKIAFEKYRELGVIDRDSFLYEMRTLVLASNHNNAGKTTNQVMQMDSALMLLYRFFDIDKNGILDVSEVAASLVILCKGSMASKIKFAIEIFSSVDTETESKILFSEFKRLIHFIFKLSLESSN